MRNMKLNKGFSLIELIIVLAVVGVAIAAVFRGIPAIQASRDANSESQNLSNIVASIDGFYASSNSYTGLTTAMAICAKAVPQAMVTAAATCTANPPTGGAASNTWGGTVAIVPVTYGVGAVANNAFTVTYNSVPSDACIKFAAQAAPNYPRVRINGTAAANTVKDTNSATPVALNQGAIALNCNGAAVVPMEFTFI